MEVLAFEVGGRRGAIPAADVEEIVRMVWVEPLPGAPPGVDGAITVRGEAVPVLDLGQALGQTAHPAGAGEHLILVRAGQRTAALRVERALELLEVDPARIERPARAAPGIAYLAEPEAPLLFLADLPAFLAERIA